jgi:hypothetical protein
MAVRTADAIKDRTGNPGLTISIGNSESSRMRRRNQARSHGNIGNGLNNLLM